MQDAKKRSPKTRFLYGRIENCDKLADVLAELLQDEPDYNSIVAELVGCSMCSYENGSNSIDDNGSDVGDDYNVDSYPNFEF